MRIGSLFSGAGGLDLAALDLFPGSSMAWHSEIEPAACKVLAHHWPEVLNLGDVSRIDWSTVEPVDVLTGGFPCQDLSLAGQRRGMAEGTRSGLWSHMFEAVRMLRPKFVLIENVRGLLSAQARRGDVGAVCEVESGSGSVGAGGDGSLRALGAVLGDLSSIGFDACWVLVRASDVGACHQRARVFVLAYPADSAGECDAYESIGRAGEGEPVGTLVGAGDGVDARGATEGVRRLGGVASVVAGGVAKLLPTPQVADVTGGHRTRSGARSNELLLPGVAEAYTAGALLPTPRASDGTNGGPNQRGSKGDLMLPSAVVQLLPTPTASEGERGDCPAERARRTPGLISIDHYLPRSNDSNDSWRWGRFAPAIHRQERLSRPAPPPTVPTEAWRRMVKRRQQSGYPKPVGMRGSLAVRVQLNPAFAEWLMFWPAGWVTASAIGLKRAEQLKCIGNGVVPVQAVAAFRFLLSAASKAVAA